MRTLLFCVVVGAIGFFSFKSSSTTSTAGYGIGDAVADFNLKNANSALSQTGKMVSLKSYEKAKGYIVTFTCNSCPYSVAYEDRLIDLHKKYASKGYPVIAINPNDIKRKPSDSFSEMTVRANDKKFPFAYLRDDSQDIATAFGARKTPHIFLLERKGDKKIVQFIGAIDDNTEPDRVKVKYLENAIDELLAGKPVTKTTAKAIGCTIKWKKQ